MGKHPLLVGRIGAAHGVRGEVKVMSYMDCPEALGQFGSLTDAGATRNFDIKLLRQPKPAVFVARIAGVQTREEAEALRNVELYLDRARLPVLSDNEFYHADLIGVRVEDRAGAEVGTVTALFDFGAGNILQVTSEDGVELLFPFTRKVVLEVDLHRKKAIIDPPAEVDAQLDEAPAQTG